MEKMRLRMLISGGSTKTIDEILENLNTLKTAEEKLVGEKYELPNI